MAKLSVAPGAVMPFTNSLTALRSPSPSRVYAWLVMVAPARTLVRSTRRWTRTFGLCPGGRARRRLDGHLRLDRGVVPVVDELRDAVEQRARCLTPPDALED